MVGKKKSVHRKLKVTVSHRYSIRDPLSITAKIAVIIYIVSLCLGHGSFPLFDLLLIGIPTACCSHGFDRGC